MLVVITVKNDYDDSLRSTSMMMSTNTEIPAWVRMLACPSAIFAHGWLLLLFVMVVVVMVMVVMENILKW